MSSEKYSHNIEYVNDLHPSFSLNSVSFDTAGRRVSRSPVVLPSSELDAHLHTTAAQITKKRESKVAWYVVLCFIISVCKPLKHYCVVFRNCVEDDKEGCLSNSCHGDDLMIPPAVLLQMSMREAEKANDNKEVLHCLRSRANISLSALSHKKQLHTQQSKVDADLCICTWCPISV